MILTARIAKTGIRRLRKRIKEETGTTLLYSSRVRDLETPGRRLHFRYGFSLPLPKHLKHKETEFNTPEDIKFLSNKISVAKVANSFSFLQAPVFKREEPQDSDFPLIIRETLDSFGGKGMHLVRCYEEWKKLWRPSYWWCSYIHTKDEYRFHIGKSKKNGVQILRVMKKVPRTPEIEEKDLHIRHVSEYHYSKRYNPYEKFPRWCSHLHQLAETLPGWLYSLDVGVTPGLSLVIFEANTASGIDNGCARDYAAYIIEELEL